MTFREQCAILAVDPYWVHPDEVARLDDWQLANIYFCPRDEHGKPIPDPIPEGTPEPTDDLPDFDDYETMFRFAMEAEGKTPEEIEQLVQALGMNDGEATQSDG